MTDYFALLHEPRRPRLDPDRLRRTFLGLAAETHPDRTHNAPADEQAAANRRYAELNAAYHCLAEPKARLRHLLELERGAKPADIQTIPPALADLFAGIADVCRQADAFLLERDQVTSPLLKIQWFERAQEWIGRLNSWQQKLGGLRDELNARLEQLDQQWLEANPSINSMAPPAVRETDGDSPSLSAIASATADTGGEGRGEGGRFQTDVNQSPPQIAPPPALLSRIEELYRLFGYFNRWQNQLQERVARLTCE